MPQIKFSQHAEDQLKIRNIPKIRIKQTILKPDSSYKSYRGRKILNKKYYSKTLEVITREEGDDIIVITAYYLEK